ncbi:MAG: hypothetical protein EA360_04765 [Balneolaceae bacterium]|nr:MAG: hypothetical protein EA360_04765 [Balneolaceae bacterium]
MEYEKPLVDKEIIKSLLYGDGDYMQEFIKVSIVSFTEFKDNFSLHFLSRDVSKLRATGHKVKPVAQMMNLFGLLELYEEAKLILEAEKEQAVINHHAEKMDHYCLELISELEAMVE